MLPNLLALGATEHFLTDYGDEANYRLPWDLFTKESAEEALKAARQCLEQLNELLEVIAARRTKVTEATDNAEQNVGENGP